MLETCHSCGTVFNVDENSLSHKIKWLRCSVCNEKWSFSSIVNKNSHKSDSKNNESIVLKQTKFIDKSEQVKHELASIKSVVEDKTKIMSQKNNHVLAQKNKSVAEIASELSKSKVQVDKPNKTKTVNKLNNKTNKQNTSLFPFLLLIITLLLSGLLVFRSALLGFSLLYFSKSIESYIPKVNEVFNYIKLPILAEISNMDIVDFVATFQNRKAKFSGIIRNTSNRPILVPRVKILAVREDRKIILEKVLILKAKIIKPLSEIKFSEIVEMPSNKENISVKVTLLKKIYNL